MVVGDFNTPLTLKDRSPRQKINKETVSLNDTLDQMDITSICSAFHPKTKEYVFFLSAHETFARIYHMLGHKTGLNQFKKIETIACIFADHNGIKLEINHKKK